MHDSYTQFIFILAKLHTGGVAAVADAVRMQRSSLFAAMAGKRPVPHEAFERMTRFLRVDESGFGRSVVEPWLARDDADLLALENLGVTVTVSARIQSSTERSRGTAQKHYFLVKAAGWGTDRYAIVRMRPSVSEAFQKRKEAEHIATYVADYRHIGLLHTLSTDIDSDEPLAIFVRAVAELGLERSSAAAQKELNLALEKAAATMAVKEEGRNQRMPVLEDPALINELAMDLAGKIYLLEILNRNLADAVGKTNAGRPTTIEIMSVSGDKIHMSSQLIQTRPQHLLVFKVHHISGFPVFEIVYDGPFEGILNIKRSNTSGSQLAILESGTGQMEISIKDLRSLDDGVESKLRLKKR